MEAGACLCVGLLFCSLFFSSPAFADISNPGDVGGMGSLFNAFSSTIRNDVWPRLMATDAYKFSFSLYSFFAAILIFEVVLKFMWEGVTLLDVLEKLFLLAMVRALMAVYDPATSALWGWADVFGGSVQEAAVGTSELFFVPSYISGIMSKISWLDMNIFSGAMAVVSLIVLSLLTGLLSVLSYFSVAWGVWGYTVAKLIGWMFVPMILFKRLEFLWEGWMRFFFGFLMYTVMARVQLSLVAIVFRLYFNFPIDYSLGAPVALGEVHSLSDFLGLLVMTVIAICGLISTGRFAAAVAGGVGGFGDALRTVAKSAASGLKAAKSA